MVKELKIIIHKETYMASLLVKGGKMKEALFVTDMQNDFTYGALRNEDAIKIIPIIKNLIEDAIKNNIDVYFTLDTHDKNYLNTKEGRDLPIEHCIKGTKGHEIVDELKPYANKSKALIEKNAFGSLDIPKYIGEYDKITFVGTCTDICVISNVFIAKAFYPEKEFVVIDKACAGVSKKAHDSALDSMRSCYIKVI